MKKEWKNPKFIELGIENTEDLGLEECPLDPDAGLATMDECPEDNRGKARCNYPGCTHKRHKKSKPYENRCYCHQNMPLPGENVTAS